MFEDILTEGQQQAVRNLNTGKILGGEVGSGKSRTSLAYFFTRYNPSDTKLVIITTAKKRDSKDWDYELKMFPDCDYIVESWNKIQQFVTVKSSFFIFDEQRVIGTGSWANSFLAIARKNDWILLSATPGDKWEDYETIFIANKFYRNRSEYRKEHIVYNPYVEFRSVQGYRNVKKLEQLRASLLVDIPVIRNRQRHIVDLSVMYDVAQYRQIAKTRKNPETGRPIQNASQYCAILRRVVNSHTTRAKYVQLITSDHPKVIIFYNYDFELDILKSIEYDDQTEIAEWNGHKHEPIPDSYRWVYLVQYMAGAEGWNCINTDTMIFYSLNYSYRIMEQSEGRIDRHNTPFKDLYYYRLISDAPLDMSILRAVNQKELFNARSFSKGKFNNGTKKKTRSSGYSPTYKKRRA